ncbi:MAG TPA: Holliday junction resolvase RecU [Patescibacteria group bacterium]|nr:Holliday junction resolvase RecU [Patescibacteria group bacterium]
MNSGKLFERDFKDSIPKELFFYRLRDGTASFGGSSDNVRFQASNICDCVLFDNRTQNRKLLLLELKSHKGKSIPLSCIRPNQMIELAKANMCKGVYPGIIFNFRDAAETYFVMIDEIASFTALTERKSIPINWIREKGIHIPQQLKKVRYRYDIETFLERLESVHRE